MASKTHRILALATGLYALGCSGTDGNDGATSNPNEGGSTSTGGSSSAATTQTPFGGRTGTLPGTAEPFAGGSPSAMGGGGGFVALAGASSGGATAIAGGATAIAGAATTGGTVAGGTSTKGGASSTGGTTGINPSTTAVPSLGCNKTAALKSGTITLTSAGLTRQYIIDIPANYDSSHPYKLVFGFHWMGGTMTDVATGRTVTQDVWSYLGLKALDTPRTAIFVAPQGIDNGWANTNDRDLTLADDMVKQITEGLCIDKSRIFAGGFSFGGMFSSTLACKRPEVFRALAPQNGSGSCSNQKPVAFFASGSNDGTNESLLRYARTIAKANGCSNPDEAMPFPTKGSLLHTCKSFEGCPAAFPVRFCAFDQNHKAAPFDGGCAECDDGRKTWTPKEVWTFYSQF